MNPLVCTLPTLAVSAIYCLWQTSLRRQVQRRQKLAERITYMLWVAAQNIPDEPEDSSREPKAAPRKNRSGPALPRC